jgi:hypothetical protein
MSTPQEREAFVKAVRWRDIDDIIKAIEPRRGFDTLKHAWNAATPYEQPTDPAPSNSAEPPAVRRLDGDGNYEVLKSRWVEYCEADFAALPAATQTRLRSASSIAFNVAGSSGKESVGSDMPD